MPVIEIEYCDVIINDVAVDVYTLIYGIETNCNIRKQFDMSLLKKSN